MDEIDPLHRDSCIAEGYGTNRSRIAGLIMWRRPLARNITRGGVSPRAKSRGIFWCLACYPTKGVTL